MNTNRAGKRHAQPSCCQACYAHFISLSEPGGIQAASGVARARPRLGGGHRRLCACFWSEQPTYPRHSASRLRRRPIPSCAVDAATAAHLLMRTLAAVAEPLSHVCNRRLMHDCHELDLMCAPTLACMRAWHNLISHLTARALRTTGLLACCMVAVVCCLLYGIGCIF